MSSHPASPPTTSDASGPAGTLAFLFTDIEGSTRLWERLPDAMRVSLSQHDRILRAAVEDQGGRVVKTTGDGVMAVFSTARHGLAACLGAQLALARETWGATGPLRVRMGLHVGEGAREGADFHGQSVNRAARIMAAGHGGQVLLSAATAALVMDGLPEGVSLRDLGEHHFKDLSRPERVFQLVHPDLPTTFPPLTTVDERRHSLPAEPSAFVGRDAERGRIREHLADESIRLLTLTGPGGIGKTRLALRAAKDLEDRFEAGALFIDLSAARDASSLLMTISRELGLPDASEGSQADELTAGIGRQHLLLVLDNFEQVASAAPTLSRLLADCPRLTLLVTSREALHVRGERLFPVPPMTLPDTALKSLSAEQVAAFEAVQLFVERARTVRPDFRVTDENAAVLAEICRRLEGVPLAIELATARLRVYSLEALRDRLDSQLRALGSGARDLPERQQTLRATIEWSYELLSPGEQRLLDVLACFAGTDVEAVEAVAGGPTPWLAGIDPIDGLVSLVDKSLVRRVDRGDDEPRFEMLASVREFAAERLEGSPELAEQARSAHAAHYASWVAQRLGGLAGPGRTDVLDRLATEADNLRLAWRRSVAERDLARLEVLIQGLRPLYDTRGWYRGVSDLAGDMLAVLEELPPSPERALTTVVLRSDQARALAATDGYTDEVEAAYERLLASLEGLDMPQVFPVLRGLATFHMFRIENDRAAELARRILVLAEQEGDVAMQVAGRLVLGSAISFLGRLEDGIGELEAGVRWFETHSYDGDWFRLGPDPRVGCLTALSLLRWWEGSVDRSLERSEQAVALARAGGHPSSLGYGLHHASLLRLWRGEPEAARDRAVQVIEVATEHDLHIWKAVGTVILGASTVALGSHEEGLRWLLDGLERYRGMRTPPVFWPFLLQVTATACALAGRTELGLRSVDEALVIMPVVPDLHLARGDLLVARDPETAAVEYEQAWEAARRWGAATSALRAAIRLCRLRAPADVSSARLERLREVLGMLSEGLDSPDHVAARELLRASA